MIITGIARLGRDCELRYLPGGDAVTNLSLAWNYGKRNGNEQPSQWAELALFGKRAEALAPHLLKGTVLSITAEDVHIETYTKRDQTSGSKIVGRIIALEFAGGGKRDSASQPSTHKPAANAPTDGAFDGFDDDIPF